MVLTYVNLIHNCIISYSLPIILLLFFTILMSFQYISFISLIHDMHLMFHITDTYPVIANFLHHTVSSLPALL